LGVTRSRDYPLLFLSGLGGMLVAHFLGFLGLSALRSSGLSYGWSFPLVFATVSVLWILRRRTEWFSTALTVCLAPVLYFGWIWAQGTPTSLGANPFPALLTTVGTALVVSWFIDRKYHRGTR